MVRVSHTCRQLLNSFPGGARSCPLQGCYPQRPVNSLWPVASCLRGTSRRGGAGGTPRQGSRETAAKERAGMAAEKREERNKMTPKEDDQQSQLVPACPETRDTAQVQHGTWCPSPRTQQPRRLLLRDHWAPRCLCTPPQPRQPLQTPGCHSSTVASLAPLWGSSGLTPEPAPEGSLPPSLTPEPVRMHFTCFCRAWLNLVSDMKVPLSVLKNYLNETKSGSCTANHYRRRYMGLYDPLFYKQFLKITSSQGCPVPAANPSAVAALPVPSHPCQYWLTISLLELKRIKAPNRALSTWRCFPSQPHLALCPVAYLLWCIRVLGGLWSQT